MANNRIRFFDCTRALCMLYIIGLWHMQEYLVGSFNIISPFTEIITRGVLGTFTFISAYFLGKKPINSWKDAAAFYKRRLIRLYPLFFISCTSLLVIHFLFHINFISGWQQYALTLVGLSVIIPPAPKTVWYVCMIILFYLLTPLISCMKTLLKQLICFLAVMLPLVIMHLTLNWVDERVLLNFPVFFAGLLLSTRLKMTDRPDWRAYVFGAGLFGIGVWLCLWTGWSVLNIVPVVGFILLAFEIGKLCVYLGFLQRILSFISFGSMVAYLFHRQFFGAAEKLIGHFPVYAAYLILLPVLLVLSYFVQLLYDKLLNGLSKSISKKRADINCIRKN